MVDLRLPIFAQDHSRGQFLGGGGIARAVICRVDRHDIFKPRKLKMRKTLGCYLV